MAILPDLQALRAAADAVDQTAVTVETDAAGIDRLVDAVPWRGPLRNRVVGDAKAAVGVARAQAAAEQALARALRQLASDVERELQLLAALAAQARRHLEDLLRRAQAMVTAAENAVAVASSVVHDVARVVVDIITADAAAALRDARHVVGQALEVMRTITVRLQTLPDITDPIWHGLAPDILGWTPL